MNRQEAREILPIVQAFAEGKTIQVKAIDDLWYDDEGSFNFNMSPERYRIKPEPKYRPFKDAEECWEEMQKHQPFGWIKKEKMMLNIINIGANGIIVHNSKGNRWYTFTDSSFVFTFADGEPFGVKVME